LTDSSIRAELVELLRSNDDEFAEMFMTRIRNSDQGAHLDATGLAGLRLASAEMIEAIRTRIEEGDRWPDELPPGVISSIQYYAREGMSLEDVLRSFAIVGTTMFEFISAHLQELSQPEDALRYLATVRGLNEDRMMAAFATEYENEKARLENAPTRQLADRITGLLDGGFDDFADLDYRFNGHHVGLIARGPRAELACRRIAERIGCELLLLPRPEETCWAWLGSRKEIAIGNVIGAATLTGDDLTMTVGESQSSLEGWRATHREARAALAVALLEPAGVTRHSDVALLAAAHGSEVTGKALLGRYLTPLDNHRNGDELRGTLRAYLDTGCNAASAAATLEVDRHTVQRRLRRIEAAVGEPPSTRRSEFDIALRLERLTESTTRIAAAAPMSHEVPTAFPSRTDVARHEQASR
jgi:hypothetical protein